MDTFFTLCMAAGILSLLLLLFNTFFVTTYRCAKCGYVTSNRLDAQVHEKIENSHKMVS